MTNISFFTGKIRLTWLSIGCWVFFALGSAALAEEKVFITEFMAANTKTLADKDREPSDWLEIYNAGTNSVNLDGWYLTDDPVKLAKWQFPATTLAARGFLVVFASGKNRRVAGAELHTNFKLKASGGYLALIKPDGVTKAFQFGPAYPAQVPNASYGLGISDVSTTLLASSAAKRVLVPAADLGKDWASPEFNDATWSAGANGVGYDISTNYLSLIGANVRTQMFNKNSSAYIRVPFVSANSGFEELKLRMRYNDGFIAYLNGVEIARRNAPATVPWNSQATAAHGSSSGSSWEENFESDAARYTLNQTEPTTRARITGPNSGSTGQYLRLINGRQEAQVNSIALPQAAPGPFETIIADFDFRCRSGGDGEDGLAFMLIPTSVYGKTGPGIDLASYGAMKQPNFPGVFGVGFNLFPRSGQNKISLHWDRKELTSALVPQADFASGVFHHAQISIKHESRGARIAVTLTPDINGARGRPYTPIQDALIARFSPFESRVQIAAHIAQVARIVDLDNLKVQFIPKGNLPSFEEIDISQHRGLLRSGANLLAIHGLNISAGDPDFFILPELTGRNIQVNTKAGRYFEAATPGAANPEGVEGIAPPPKFSTESGVYAKDFSLQLTAANPAAVIHYTLDGKEPSRSSPVYAAPLTITGSTLLKARAFDPHLLPSPTVSRTYTMLDASLANFNSNLPLVILNTFGQSRGASDNYREQNSFKQSYSFRQRSGRHTKVPVSARFINAPTGRNTLTGPTDFDGRGTINVRGYSSLRYSKLSYALKTRDEADEPLKASILGFPKDSDWILYAPYPDKTLMRDVLAYELSNKMGHYAVRTKFVEVFLNRNGSKLSRRDYLGVYVFEEKIKRGKQRVDIAELKPDDNTEPNITGGYIFKRDHLDRGEEGFSTSRGNTFFYVYPDLNDITPEQKAWLQRYVSQFERALYGSNFANPETGYARYLDVDSFIDQHWLIELSKNIDGYRYSAFIQKDRGGKLKMEPVWDWNLSFGNADYHGGAQTDSWYWPLIRQHEISWYRRLSQDPDFLQRVIDRWGELRKNQFAPANILGRVDELAALLNEAQARNFQRWPILGEHVHPNAYVGQSYADEVHWMKQWIQKRIAWIDSQMLRPPALSLKEGQIATGASLAIRAPAGKIYYTLDGTDPRLPGGEVASKAQLYDSAITLKGTAKVFARVNQNSSWSSPARATFTVKR